VEPQLPVRGAHSKLPARRRCASDTRRPLPRHRGERPLGGEVGADRAHLAVRHRNVNRGPGWNLSFPFAGAHRKLPARRRFASDTRRPLPRHRGERPLGGEVGADRIHLAVCHRNVNRGPGWNLSFPFAGAHRKLPARRRFASDTRRPLPRHRGERPLGGEVGADRVHLAVRHRNVNRGPGWNLSFPFAGAHRKLPARRRFASDTRRPLPRHRGERPLGGEVGADRVHLAVRHRNVNRGPGWNLSFPFAGAHRKLPARRRFASDTRRPLPRHRGERPLDDRLRGSVSACRHNDGLVRRPAPPDDCHH
jgi:hypothetical protein